MDTELTRDVLNTLGFAIAVMAIYTVAAIGFFALVTR